jgi:methionyl-tRNA formyltransferase
VKVAFLGYGEIGTTVLGGVASRHHVGMVVTHESGFTGLETNGVLAMAEERGLPVVSARNAGEPQVLAALREFAPEVLVSANWRTTVPESALEIPSLYPLNVHDALLPAYAGFGSVNWAIRNGDTEIGLTVHVMEAELDTGPVVCQVVVPIGPEDTAGDVYRNLLAEYPGAVLKALELVGEGATPTKQSTEGATFYHRITLADTRIDWALPTERLLNLVRAQSDPFLNAWFTAGDRRVFVKRAVAPLRDYRGTPGRVLRHAEGGVAVACGPSWESGSRGLILLEVQPEGQQPLPASEYFRKPGAQLT